MDYTRKASIQRKTLWQQIADVLREDIIRGKIKPGERIVEEDIAEKFHVSRGPVREALRHIGEEGFVVYESHKGSTVKTISYEEMQEKYLVRSTLEVLAIRIIAGKLPEEIEREMDECLEQMEKAAMELHEVREQNAVKFAEEIVHQMSELNFLDARFEIRLTEAKSYSAQGKDDAEFYLSVNPGEPVRPLGDVASGGELSRIMLAIKTVLADEEDTPTLIFDEIDSGISGITAGRVGERLQLIGKSRQVICITHLSQIAAAADVHFCIHKEAEDNSVRTQIKRLDQEDSVAELARLLGGANVTDGIIDSAREMKELAKREK